MSSALTADRRRIVVAIGLGQLLAWGSSFYLLAIVARPMAATLQLPGVWVYAFFSAALLVAAALGPWVGARIDRHGGRRVLLLSNLLFALALFTLAAAQGPISLLLGWLLMGLAMPFGLYDAAFSTVVSLYGADARRSIVGVTLVAGFASSVSWPLTAAIEAHSSWRVACVTWALLHLSIGIGLHAWMLPKQAAQPVLHVEKADAPPVVAPGRVVWLLAIAFAASGFVFAALAAHLPRLLQAIGCTAAVAVAASSLLGVMQVTARFVEAGLLSRLHPLTTARLSVCLHPLGALLIGLFGAPMAFVYTALHGAGVGLMTIVKGLLPLALFGPGGFGRRAGLLEAPARVAQASAPILFGLALDQFHDRSLWLLFGVALIGVACMLSLRLPSDSLDT